MVTRMWRVMCFLQISNAMIYQSWGASEECGFSKIANTKKEEKTKNNTQSTTDTQNNKPPLKTGSEFVTCTVWYSALSVSVFTELEKLYISSHPERSNKAAFKHKL